MTESRPLNIAMIGGVILPLMHKIANSFIRFHLSAEQKRSRVSGNVFISYRRALSPDAARRIAALLRQRLPRARPYLDVESIAFGTNFVDAIQSQLSQTRAVLVLMPPGWAEIRDAQGQPRLWQRDDRVREEVATALKRGVPVIPVLMDRAAMPAPDALPEDLRDLTLWNAVEIGSELGDADQHRLVQAVAPKLPGRLSAALLSVIAMSAGSYLLPYFVLSGLILFCASLLQIHFIAIPATGDTPARDLGFFFALNWTVVMFLLWPLALYLFQSALRRAQRFFESVRARQLVVFIDADGQGQPRSPDAIWSKVLNRTSRLIALVIVLSFVLASIHWYQFSGRWPVADFPKAAFLEVSTGLDWQVAWGLLPRYGDTAGWIKAYAFLCYQLYNIVWILKFAILIFAFVMVSELGDLATGSGVYRSERLRLTDAGPGLAELLDLRRLLALIALVSALAMYFMAIRNHFLPLPCRPHVLRDGSLLIAHCQSTLGQVETSFRVLADLIAGLRLGQGADWSVLTMRYGPAYNSFTIGPVFDSALMLMLFVYVAIRLASVIDSAAANGAANGAAEGAAATLAPVTRRMRRHTLATALVMALAAISMYFPNVSAIFIAALTLLLLCRAY